MKTIIRFSADHPWLILWNILLLCAVGLWSLSRLPLDAVPDITNNQVQVNTFVEGLAPEQIESQVSQPLEASLSGVPGVLQVRSLNRPRLSQVTVVFKDAMDPYLARQLVSERLTGLVRELPAGAVPQLGPMSTGLGEVFMYSLDHKEKAVEPKARQAQLMELTALQEWVVKPRFLRVPGVAEVSVTGGYERQAVIQPDPVRMAERGIHFDDLAEAVEKAARTVGGGLVERGAEQFSVAVRGTLADLEALKRLPVKSDQSLAGVKVGDLAGVSWGAAPRTGASTRQGSEGLICVVLMVSGENGRSVARGLDQKTKEVSKDLPATIVLEPVLSRGDLVDKVLDTVFHNLAYGAFLVVLVLFLLLGNTRAALITAVTIPVSMLLAVIVMRQLGVSGNLMSLGAVDFGILVDGAVIVIDHCVRLLGEKRRALKRALSREEVRETVAQATLEVRTAAGFGEIIIATALLPLFGLSGVEAKTFTPMVIVLVLGLLAAWAFSFTGAPALAFLLLGRESKSGAPPRPALSGKGRGRQLRNQAAGAMTHSGDPSETSLMRWVRLRYEPILEWCLERPGKLLAGALVLLVLSLFLYTRLGAVFMPRLDEGGLVIQFSRPPNISLSQALRLQEISEGLLLEFPQVASVFGRIGTAELASDPMGVNFTDTFLTLKDRKDWPKDGPRTKQDLEALIVGRFKAEVPGQRVLVTQPIEMRFNEILEGTKAEVAVKVFGDDLGKISASAEEIVGVLRTVRGAGDVELEVQGTSPVISVEPRLALLSNLGVSPGEVMDAVESGLAGREVGRIYPEGGRWFPVVVRLGDEARNDPDTLRKLPVGVGGADTRPLGDLADIRSVDSYSTVVREQGRRRAAVLVNTRGRDVESFVKEAQDRIAASVKLPEGYYLEWGGAFRNLQEARSRLALLTPLALGLVLFMVYAAFRDLGLSLLVFAGVPLALIGGVTALSLRGMPFSISAGVGFIALAGIAVLNGVVLTSNLLELRRKGVAPETAARKAALGRLRPVLMTALVEIFGFLPMMFSTGLGSEVQQPLATVVVGGVFSATVLTLLTLPSWQVWMARTVRRV